MEIPVYVDVNYPDSPTKYELMNRHIDACLAPHIFKLNNNGAITRNCCCGHKQDRRFNTKQLEDKDHRGSILIDDNCVRYADSIGYHIIIDEYNHSIVEINSTNKE